MFGPTSSRLASSGECVCLKSQKHKDTVAGAAINVIKKEIKINFPCVADCAGCPRVRQSMLGAFHYHINF